MIARINSAQERARSRHAQTSAMRERGPAAIVGRMLALVVAAVALYLLGADPALAQGDLGQAGENLLGDLGPWLLVGVVGGAALFAIKGRTSWAITVFLLGIVLWGITAQSDRVQGLADSIWSIFGG